MSRRTEQLAPEDCLTVIGRFDDSGDTTIAVITRDADHADPHWAALRHTGALSESGEFEVVAVLRGRCDILVTQQSLRLFCDRLLLQDDPGAATIAESESGH